MEFDISKTVEKIVMQAKENQEEFIFETIQPYCENILQMKINKEELKQILLNSTQKQQSCEDCISRQAAIDVVRKWFDKIQLNGDICLDGIISLPSITSQLETCEDAISRADLLKYAQLVRDDEGIVHEMVHVDDIKDASSVTWSSWTPATQPPEPDTAVLLYVKYKSSGQWTYQLGMWNDNKQSWEDWRTPYQLEEEFEIIEWTEVPER